MNNDLQAATSLTSKRGMLAAPSYLHRIRKLFLFSHSLLVLCPSLVPSLSGKQCFSGVDWFHLAFPTKRSTTSSLKHCRSHTAGSACAGARDNQRQQLHLNCAVQCFSPHLTFPLSSPPSFLTFSLCHLLYLRQS